MKDSNDKFETFLFYITAFKYNKKFIQKLDLFEYENKPSFHSNYKELRNLFKNSKEKIWKEFGLFFKVDKKEHNENLDKVNLIQNKIRGRFGHTDSVREAYFEIESLLTEAEKNLFSNNRTSFISSFILVSENILEALILSNYIKKDIITKYFRNSKKSLNSYTYKQKIKIMEEHLENTELKYQYKPFLKIIINYSKCFDIIRNEFVMHPYFLDRYRKLKINPKQLFLDKIKAIKSKLNLIEELMIDLN